MAAATSNGDAAADDLLYVEAAHSDVCDRRLSRAARSILERLVLPVLVHHYGAQSSSNNNNRQQSMTTASLAPVSLWEGLQDAIPLEKVGGCILEPNRDVFQHSEKQSLLVHAGPSTTTLRMQLLPYKTMLQVYKCGICGKSFMTRYYLDIHMDHNHSVLLPSENWVCPAVSWCRALGGTGACQTEALDAEPYYGRGSGGFGVDSKRTRQEWSKATHEWHCDDRDMMASQEYCRSVMHSCFDKHLATDLIHAVCDGLTCQDALHRLMGQARRHVHSWSREWSLHHDVRLGWKGVCIVAILVGFYVVKACLRVMHMQQRAQTNNVRWNNNNKSTRRKQWNLKKRLEEIRNSKKTKVQ